MATLCSLRFSDASQGPLAGAVSSADGLIASPEKGWPQWRGLRRDGISSERDLLAAWPSTGPRLLWKAEGIGRGWSSPIATGGSIFVTGDVCTNLVVFCLNLRGQLIWKCTNGLAWTGSYPGARACCAYSQGVVYHLNAHGRMAALEARTGRELWAVEILQRFGGPKLPWAIAECVLVDGPRVLVTPGGSKALMAALDKTTGETVWVSEPGGAPTYTSPILFRQGGRRLVANCSAEHGFGADADTGKLLWTVPLANTYGVTCSTPVYGEGCVFYVTTDAVGGSLYQVAASERAATLLWKTPVDALTSSGVLVDGLLYTSGCKRTKSLHCLDWKTGQERATLKLSTGNSAYVSVAMFWAAGRLYCQAQDGTVALLDPQPARFEVAGRFQLVDARNGDARAHPVLLDGRLYLRYHETLWCYEVGVKPR
ncbi:MAG: PQQ-binding-like beta-propeller repeat protein [Verrucomicrobia bacterium]|nr:PQQ-binding-like beta-propeller repeat protein [Verrucomicrobiota bacterium]